jgi:hypothetical protein
MIVVWGVGVGLGLGWRQEPMVIPGRQLLVKLRKEKEENEN